MDGKVLETLNIEDEKVNIKIIEVKNENDAEENYAACWDKNEVFYQVSGKMKRQEFMKLIRKMYF